MLNVFRDHAGLGVVRTVLEAFLKVVCHFLKIAWKFSVLNIELLPFEFDSSFWSFVRDGANCNYYPICLFERSGVEDVNLLVNHELLNKGEIGRNHVSWEVASHSTFLWEVYICIWLINVKDFFLDQGIEMVDDSLIIGVDIIVKHVWSKNL